MKFTLKEIGVNDWDLITVPMAAVEKNMTPGYINKKIKSGDIDYVRIPVGRGYKTMVVKNEKYEYCIRESVNYKDLWKVILKATRDNGSSIKTDRHISTENS